MIIPIGHEETTLRRVPWVTFGIMGLCALAFLFLERTAGLWGLVPAHLTVLPLFTHMFMHAGWLHLLGNLFILYLAGPYLEDVWGRTLFTAFYLTSGLGAALVFVVRYPELQTPLVGASGAIAGVMGGFLVRYMRTRIRFAYLVTLRARGTFDAPAWLMLPLWFVQQLFFAAMTDADAGAGVAYLAHIGGFGFGVAGAWGIRLLDLEARFIARRIESSVTTVHVDRPALDRALAAKGAGNARGAFDLLIAEAARAPNDRDVALAFWDVASGLGRAAEAAPMMARVVRHELKNGESHLAAAHWAELRGKVPDVTLDPVLLVRLAQVLAQEGQRQEAIRAIQTAMRLAGRGMEPVVSLRMARVAMSLDGEVGRRAASFALALPGIDPDTRRQVESLTTQFMPVTAAGRSR